MKNYAHFRRTLLRAATPLLLAGGLVCLGGAAHAGTPATHAAVAATIDEQLAVQANARGDAPSAYYFAVKSVNDAYATYYAYSLNPSSVTDLAAVYSAFAASSGAIALSAAANGDYGTARAYANAAAGYEQSTVVVYFYTVDVYNYSPTDENQRAFDLADYSDQSAIDSADIASNAASGVSPANPFLASAYLAGDAVSYAGAADSY